MYCVKCKKKTNTLNIIQVLSKNNRQMIKGTCDVCGRNKSSFIKSGDIQGGSVDIHSIIGKLPRPNNGWTLPNHKYTGPWNPLDKQLDENDNPVPGQEPYNQVDAIALKHDICYRDHEDNKHGCDRVMIEELNSMTPKNFREKIDRGLVKAVIGTKLKLGLGNKGTTSSDKKSLNSKRGPVKKQ